MESNFSKQQLEQNVKEFTTVSQKGFCARFVLHIIDFVNNGINAMLDIFVFTCIILNKVIVKHHDLMFIAMQFINYFSNCRFAK